MNRNLYTKELKRNRKNLITWTLIVVGLTFMVLSIFPYMSEMGSEMAIVMDKIPNEMKKAMGMDNDTWSSILGFYSTYFGIYIVVLIGIYSGSTGASILSKEEREGTSEFLFSKPISRPEIFWTKMGSLFTLMLIIYFIQTGIAALGISLFGPENLAWSKWVAMQINGLFLVLIFTAFGVLVSFFFRPKKNFMGMIVGVVFGMYFISAIAKAADAVNFIGYISPFNYVTFDVLNPNYSVHWLPGILLCLISFGFLYSSLRIFTKKDIEA